MLELTPWAETGVTPASGVLRPVRVVSAGSNAAPISSNISFAIHDVTVVMSWVKTCNGLIELYVCVRTACATETA
jgi:hypothetical protein